MTSTDFKYLQQQQQNGKKKHGKEEMKRRRKKKSSSTSQHHSFLSELLHVKLGKKSIQQIQLTKTSKSCRTLQEILKETSNEND